jgi:hypothetical protein
LNGEVVGLHPGRKMLEAAVHGVGSGGKGGQEGVRVAGWSKDFWNVVHSGINTGKTRFVKTREKERVPATHDERPKGAVFNEGRADVAPSSTSGKLEEWGRGA